MGREPVFALRGVTLRHGQTTLLTDICAQIPRAACTAIVGPSGAGKSRLLRLLVRLEDPDAGRITFHDTPLEEYDVLELRRRVQLVAQHPVLLTDSVAEEIRLGRPALPPAEVGALLERVGLPAPFHTRATSGLSGGETQRVCLARSLALDPQVLLLDEPTAALDAASACAIEHTVRDLVARGTTVVLVSHNTDQVRRLADQVIVLERGRVLTTGTPDDVDYPETQ
ncbi:ABC transporter ATP-binding protein [Jiangella muralis]|uniref:ABC transporter ATP-binding protein n=1 Tax=Jiangella muralis TaxID=702383 RepID=UPI00069F67CD|nr:ATP-binding cassette domain-containing protein [Jiangella muralis]